MKPKKWTITNVANPKTSPQNPGPDTEPFLENKTSNTLIHCLNDSRKRQLEIQKTNTDMTRSYSDNFPPSQNYNFTDWRETCEGWNYKWTPHITVLHNIPKMEDRNDVCPSGFQERLNSICPSWLKGLC